MKTILSIALVLTISGCSTAELIYIDDIRPHAGSHDATSSESETYLYDVDAYADTCCTIDEDTGLPKACVNLPVFNHRATVTFVNDTPLPENTTNSNYGTATIQNMDIEYTSNQDGPDLPKLSAAIDTKIPAGTPTPVLTDLFNNQTKKYFRELNEALGDNKVTAAQSYTAKYIFTGTNDLKIKGHVVFNIGDYNSCSSDYPISFSAYGNSLVSGE
ncbi:MAG: hypothetical protein QGI45_00125 [Myxococcota bacterium]|nr:hypothetical protein [Myxococcota bacterium]